MWKKTAITTVTVTTSGILATIAYYRNSTSSCDEKVHCPVDIIGLLYII